MTREGHGDPKVAGVVAGVITGLAAEAEIAALLRCPTSQAPLAVGISGADSGRARALSKQQIQNGATALISFGIAGGLAPEARAGQLLLPEAVLLPDGTRLPADPVWHGRLKAELGGKGLALETAALQGSATAIGTPSDKVALHRSSGAYAVDMESQEVAAVARSAGRPFLVLRAVADPATRALPAFALSATGPDGKVRLGAVLAALSRRPWDLPAALRLGWETRRALTALGRAVRLCPDLCLPR